MAEQPTCSPYAIHAVTRLEVEGAQTEPDIVHKAVWPELTRHGMRRAMTAHEQKMTPATWLRTATAPTVIAAGLGQRFRRQASRPSRRGR
jgi:hypothetical protein